LALIAHAKGQLAEHVAELDLRKAKAAVAEPSSGNQLGVLRSRTQAAQAAGVGSELLTRAQSQLAGLQLREELRRVSDPAGLRACIEVATESQAQPELITQARRKLVMLRAAVQLQEAIAVPTVATLRPRLEAAKEVEVAPGLIAEAESRLAELRLREVMAGSDANALLRQIRDAGRKPGLESCWSALESRRELEAMRDRVAELEGLLDARLADALCDGDVEGAAADKVADARLLEDVLRALREAERRCARRSSGSRRPRHSPPRRTIWRMRAGKKGS